MDVQQVRQQQQEKQQWAACDPVTLVAAAKQTLYGEIHPQQQGNASTLNPIEEVISRFEQLTRASLGSPSITTTSSRQ